ncbi:Peroxiredoxin-2 [Chelonia mydas]|uniref:thioredoxin-dependent peroxiredoxin n=1 Tax=Chelonia mydas TaxID=8469 RepID=M7C9E4_CHEMY|nr:Peroxiredoxin-2 [Chelonia mydas]
MASGNAHIGKPAPGFHAMAVVDGAFKEIKLSDYRGQDLASPAQEAWCCWLALPQMPRCNRVNTPRKEGGLGAIKIPLLSDLTRSMAMDYGVLKEDEGIAYRGTGAALERGVRTSQKTDVGETAPGEDPVPQFPTLWNGRGTGAALERGVRTSQKTDVGETAPGEDCLILLDRGLPAALAFLSQH